MELNIPQNQGVFTPRDKLTGERYRMMLSVERRANLRSHGLGYRGTVQDQLTGKWWRVYGAACSLPRCQCDAVVVEVKP
jgi:hypothetical protein